MATTNKQTDYFAKYKNVEVISGNGVSGFARVVGQLKNGRWALWQTTNSYGGNFSKPQRLPYGEVKTFSDKSEAIAFSNKII